MKIKTADAIRKAGGRDKLAAVFNITGSAVSQWGETLPRARAYELAWLRPNWFGRRGARAAKKTA